MAYDFVVGKSSKVKDSPDVVAGIEFGELPAIGRLMKKTDSSFLRRVSNFFDDAVFSSVEIESALAELYPLLLADLDQDDKHMLYKLISVLSYASSKNQNLYGVAD